MGVQLQQTKEKLRSWWQRRGNKSLPEGYFLPLTTFMIVFLILLVYAPYTYGFIWTVIRYVMYGESGDKRFPQWSFFPFSPFLCFSWLQFMEFSFLLYSTRTKGQGSRSEMKGKRAKSFYDEIVGVCFLGTSLFYPSFSRIFME